MDSISLVFTHWPGYGYQRLWIPWSSRPWWIRNTIISYHVNSYPYQLVPNINSFISNALKKCFKKSRSAVDQAQVVKLMVGQSPWRSVISTDHHSRRSARSTPSWHLLSAVIRECKPGGYFFKPGFTGLTAFKPGYPGLTYGGSGSQVVSGRLAKSCTINSYAAVRWKCGWLDN